MNIISFNQIIELNHLIEKKDLQFKVHIRDACGAQSFYIEQLGEINSIQINEALYKTIDEYFKNNKMTVVYYENKQDFTVK